MERRNVGGLENSLSLRPSVLCFFFSRCECYDYLFDVAVSMKKVGLDPTQLPVGENGIV